MHHELILILDFGSQYTQLIARRVREQGVYCEIVPFHHSLEEIIKKNPKGVILSGGPIPFMKRTRREFCLIFTKKSTRRFSEFVMECS